jgi:hydroxymethylglutaryl-CoA reductase
VLRKLLAVETAAELGVVIAAVGLAQNMAALRALATEGIQRGHMELHARSVALAAGAEGALVDQIADDLVRRGEIKLHVAEALLAALRTPERPE